MPAPDERTQDLLVIYAMKRYGGSFVKALAEAALLADDSNLRKIKTTWPEYWETYTWMAATHGAK